VLPRFRADGRELFYFQPDGQLMAVAPEDEAVAPKSLFHVGGTSSLEFDFDFDYDVAPDGRRFLLRYASEAEGAAGLRVVTEWARAID